MSATNTVLVPNARLELLRALAWYRDFHASEFSGRKYGPNFCRLVPLHVGQFHNPAEDIDLAAQECAKIGEIELADEGMMGWYVAVTDLGYDRIRAHDALGEAAQEKSA